MKWTTHSAAPEWGIDRKTLRRRLAEAGFDLHTQKDFSTQEINRAVFSDPKYESVLTERVKREILEMDRDERKSLTMDHEKSISIINSWFLPIRQKLVALPAEMSARCNPIDPDLARSELEAWSKAVMIFTQQEIRRLSEEENDREETQQAAS